MKPLVCPSPPRQAFLRLLVPDPPLGQFPKLGNSSEKRGGAWGGGRPSGLGSRLSLWLAWLARPSCLRWEDVRQWEKEGRLYLSPR